MSKLLDLYNSEHRAKAIRTLAYYDGNSKEYLMDFLSRFRKNALNKGMQPRTINLMKEVVDRSGMLFAGRAPVPTVYRKGAASVDPDDVATQNLLSVFESAQWVEFFNNFDPVVRLLKTAMVLVQHDPETAETFFTVLTQGNCAVHTVNRRIETLIYFTGRSGDVDTYRIWTTDLVQNMEVSSGGGERIVSVLPNPYGIIPVAVFHDTNIPRDGTWNQIPEDLVTINDIYNLHITDGDYVIQHAKLETLFTNAIIAGSGSTESSSVVNYGSKLGDRWVTGQGEAFVGGPGEVVGIETNGDSVYLEYKGSKPDIKPLDEVIRGWFRDYARGWSVTIEGDGAGNGAADSGFKLVVKELPNQEMRKKRQRMFEAGFRELYEVLLKMNEVFNLGLTPDTELYMQFSAPELPVDEKVSEEIWSTKISEGRASLVDYFIVQAGMSRQEAEAKVLQLAKDKAFIERATAAVQIVPQNAPIIAENSDSI